MTVHSKRSTYKKEPSGERMGSTSKSSICITYTTIQGKRATQEDRVVIESPLISNGTLHLFAVLDGHGGSTCVDFCSSKLVDYIRNALVVDTDIQMVLTRVIERLVTEWDDCSMGTGMISQLTTLEKRTDFFQKTMVDDSGTTLCCAILCSATNRLWVANLGDSRCVIKIPLCPLYSTIDHSVPDSIPTNMCTNAFPIEYDGTYINRELAMTHSIGDNCSVLTGVVQRRPDIFMIELKKESRIILATDGLYDIIQIHDIFLNRRTTASDYIHECGGKDMFADNTSIIMIDV